jgi:hypothetical protein
VHSKALYDSNVQNYFRFRTPYNSSSGFEERIDPLLDFYSDLVGCYRRILTDDALADVMRSFSEMYSAHVPRIKMLDFIFHSAGRLGLSIEYSCVAAGTKIVMANPVELNCEGLVANG